SPGWPRALATTDHHCLYRGTCQRADTACHVGAPRSSEPVPFLAGIQAISRNASTSVPDRPSHGACQAAAGRTRGLGDGHRPDDTLQRLDDIRHSVPEDDGACAHRLSPKLSSSHDAMSALLAATSLPRAPERRFPGTTETCLIDERC